MSQKNLRKAVERFTNQKSKITRRCHGPLTTRPKHTQWKRASARTLAELMEMGKLSKEQIKSISLCSPDKFKKAQGMVKR